MQNHDEADPKQQCDRDANDATKSFDAESYDFDTVWPGPKPVQEVTNARLASDSIVERVIFLRTKRKERRLGKIWQLYKPKLRVNRLRVIRTRKICESMRFDSGPEVFVRVNRNYVLTEYVQNENDCTA